LDYTNGAAWIKQDENDDAYLSVSFEDHDFCLYPRTGYVQNGLNLVYKISRNRFVKDLKQIYRKDTGFYFKDLDDMTTEGDS